MTNLTFSIGIFVSLYSLYLLICMTFMKPCRSEIKILFALQQDVLAYAGNLIYGVRLLVNVEARQAKKIF